MIKEVGLSSEAVAAIEKVRKSNETFDEVLDRVIKMGTYQLGYRSQYNKKKNEETKKAVAFYRAANKK